MTWSSILAPDVGSTWRDEHGSIRVMAVVEGYVVARRPRATPFLCTLREFTLRFGSVPADGNCPAHSTG